MAIMTIHKLLNKRIFSLKAIFILLNKIDQKLSNNQEISQMITKNKIFQIFTIKSQ